MLFDVFVPNVNIPDFILRSNLTSRRLNSHFLKKHTPGQADPSSGALTVTWPGCSITGYLLLFTD